MWGKFGGEFIDIIEWTDDSNDTLVYRFERYGNEIKYGAQLTVRETQTAVFISEGQLADIFAPGRYSLETENVPLLSTLQGWKYGFSSPFKAEVYFINTRRFTDLKWGTKNPIMLRDKEFGPVRLRAFGTYEIRVHDASVFLKEIVGTDGHFSTDEVSDQLRNLIVARFSDVVAESNIPVLDLAANYNELGSFITDEIAPEFSAYGLQLTKLLVENISLPPAVEEALDRRTSMGIVGNLNQYTQFQAAEAMRAAAENPGGTAGEGIGMGMGFAMAQQLGKSIAGQSDQAPTNNAAPSSSRVPPPPPPPARAQTSYYLARDGKQHGPYKLDTLAQMAQNDQLSATALVWSEGMDNWQAAEDVEVLAELFVRAPSLPGGNAYYVAIDHQQSGPFALDRLSQMAQSRQIDRNTLVWKEGMGNWEAAGQVAELADLFGGMPPPLPR